VLVGDLVYGICLVALHGVLLGSPAKLGEPSVKERAANSLEIGERRLADGAGQGEDAEQGSWVFQLMDLNIGWGHQLLGMDNASNETCGLIYGLATVAISVVALYATLHGASWLPGISRYAAAYMHIQVGLLGGMALAKLPTLCTTQILYLPALQPTILEHCNEAFRFMFLQRVVTTLTLASLCTWVYSSFAFVLTFGPDAHFRIDHPDHAHGLNALDAERSGKPPPPPPSAQDDGLVGGSVRVDPAAAVAKDAAGLAAGAPPSQAGDHRRHSHHHHHSRHHGQQSHHGDHRSHHSSHHSSHHHRSNYEDGADRGANRTSYNIGLVPRGGSHAPSADGRGETQALLRPPVAVY